MSEFIEEKIPYGEHDYVSIDCAIARKAKIQQAQLHVLKGCSHAPYYEDPEQYHAVLGVFLEAQILAQGAIVEEAPEVV